MINTIGQIKQRLEILYQMVEELEQSGAGDSYTKAQIDAMVATINGEIGNLSNLTTTAKTSAVAAINEVDNHDKHRIWEGTEQEYEALTSDDYNIYCVIG